MSGTSPDAVHAYLDALLEGVATTAPAPGVPESPPVPPLGASVPGSGPAPTPRLLEPMPASTAAPACPDATAPSPFTTLQPQRWVRVAVGADSYALELLCVQEVVRLAPIVAMRGADAAVLGVMNLRGRIVPVFDLGQWLGAGRVSPGERSRIVVVERDDELIGVLVDAVDDVVTLGRDRIEPPLPGTDPGKTLGVARIGVVPTVLLDANALYG